MPSSTRTTLFKMILFTSTVSWLTAQEPQPPPAQAAPNTGRPANQQQPGPGRAREDRSAQIRKMMGRPPGPDPAAVARGKQTFVANCAFCHGSNATGGEGGPDLVRSVLVLHDNAGDKIGPVVLNGRPEKGMPKFSLTQAQITDIASFLRFQVESKRDRFDYKIQNVVTGDAKAGQAYFNSHCSNCHSPTVDLAGVAKRYEPAVLQSRFIYPKTNTFPGAPDSGPKPKPTKVTVTLPSGESITGTLQHLDDFSVSLYDAEGNYRSWLRDRVPGIKIEVQDPLAAHVDLMQKYSDADMHNILAYLETLK